MFRFKFISTTHFTPRHVNRVVRGECVSPLLISFPVEPFLLSPLNSFRVVIRQCGNALSSLQLVVSRFYTVALAAPSSVLRSLRILRRVFVTLRAMSLASVGRRKTFTSQAVDFGLNRLDMDGVYAVPNATEMVAFDISDNSSDEQLIEDSVGTFWPTTEPKPSISVSTDTTSPLPTGNALVGMLSRNLNFGKDSGEKFAVDNARIDGSHSISFTDIVVRLGSVLVAPFRAVSILPQKVIL